MFRLCDKFPNHCLDNGDVSVEQSTGSSAQQGYPEVGGKSHDNHAKHGADASYKEYWLSPDPVGEAAPVHAHQGLGEGEGRDEQARVEGGVIFVTDLESLDKSPGVWEDGCQSYRLGKSNDGYGDRSAYCAGF